MAPFVAAFPEYRRALADHLVHTKLKHWEKSLREVGWHVIEDELRSYLQSCAWGEIGRP